jgi:prepilin-type N-terminal cleavage/methylation domain-containing protein
MGVRCSVPNRSSFILHPSSFIPRAFTLIEMLTVIVIIGILATLITAAAIRARTAAKNFAVRKEISDLQQALEAYKLKYLEYPPDFALLGVVDSNNVDLGQQAVLRHVQTAFPRYFEASLLSRVGATPAATTQARWNQFRADVQNPTTGYPGLDPQNFTPATALVFWLGGLPEQPPGASQKWIPAGFNADKQRPFTRASAGAPRTEPFFTFNGERLAQWGLGAASLQYNPPSIEVPYVYFRARRDQDSRRFEYGAWTVETPPFHVCRYSHPSGGGICLPYMDCMNTSDHGWCDQEKFQIIAAGMDNLFGAATDLRNLTTGDGITNADFDNITSFADGKLEDAMKQ